MSKLNTSVSLLISLLLLLQIHDARVLGQDDCPFEIIIGDTTLAGDGSECFESETENGVIARVSVVSDELVDVLVWDEDAPCGGDNESYIHYSSEKTSFQAMTAGNGELVHTYRAAVFSSGLPLPDETIGCYPFTTGTGNNYDATCLLTWHVARYGNACPETKNKLQYPSEFTPLIVAVAVLAPVLVLVKHYSVGWAGSEPNDKPPEPKVELQPISQETEVV